MVLLIIKANYYVDTWQIFCWLVTAPNRSGDLREAEHGYLNFSVLCKFHFAFKLPNNYYQQGYQVTMQTNLKSEVLILLHVSQGCILLLWQPGKP